VSAEVVVESQWRRLDARMLVIHPINEIPRAVPALIGAFVAGSSSGHGGLWALGATAITLGLALSRWFTTRYRVTPDRVEVRQGLFRRRVLAVSRDRLRTVDVTAHALHRVLGLTRVTLGTGRSDRERGGGVRLDGLTAREAASLREELLHRREVLAPTAAAQAQAPRAPETALVRLDSTWIRYAPFTLSGILTVGVALAFALNVASEARLDPTRSGPLRSVVHHLGEVALPVAVLEIVVAVLVLAALASTLAYVMAFWDFRLTRTAGNTLHVTRGLLTTRATTIEERRLHGAELSEPLLLRLAGGGRCIAIATGLRVGRGSERGGSLLLPPAPLAEARRVTAAVLEDERPVTCALHGHGLRARRRRFTRALGSWALIAAALVVAWATGAPAWLWEAWLVALPVAAALAADRYRSLGHRVVGKTLVTRIGTLVRRRSALHGAGIIGWNLERTFFQRRAGLATLTATTAAGDQHYVVQDVDLDEALRVAETALPGLLEPFLERRPT
jgi:putative membrane protein